MLYTEEFEQRYAELHLLIQKKAERRTNLFKNNPFTPTLQTEKLHPKNQAVWSFRIDEDYRIIFRFIDTRTVTLLTVGPHHWIYQNLQRFFL